MSLCASVFRAVRLPAVLLAHAVLVISGLAAAPQSPPSRMTPEEAERGGQELAAELRAQGPAVDSSGVLRRKGADGKWQAGVPVRLEVRPGADSWQTRYHALDSQGAIRETLAVVHSAGQPNRYEVLRPDAAGGPPSVKVMSGSGVFTPFAGSDFWLGDLGLDFLHWPRQRIVKTEMRKGRSCRVLESAVAVPEATGYAKVLSWIDIEKKGLLRAEAFGIDGKLLKEFSIGGFKKVGGRWQLKSMEIRNERDDARTRLEFDLEIDE
jgi:hypothetical protein